VTTISIRLFGRFEVAFGRDAGTSFKSTKATEVFSYLSLNSARPSCRETLAATLWPDSTATQHRKYLRQALWQIHQLLPQDCLPNEPNLLLSDPNWLQLNPAAVALTDVAKLECACAATIDKDAESLDDSQFALLAKSASLYRGMLLEEVESDWCRIDRERLQNLYVSMIEKLMAACELREAFELGISLGQRVLAIDRARERTHRRLMRLYNRLGDRTAALRQFQSCTQFLHDDLAVEPSQRTLLLYTKICDDQPLRRFSPKASFSSQDSARHLNNLSVILRQTAAELTSGADTVNKILGKTPR
jgi:DNA-binding SARP family transcriptional activator